MQPPGQEFSLTPETVTKVVYVPDSLGQYHGVEISGEQYYDANGQPQQVQWSTFVPFAISYTNLLIPDTTILPPLSGG